MNITESIFELFQSQVDAHLDAHDFTWLLDKAKSTMNSEIFSLLSQVSSIDLSGDHLTMSIGKSLSAPIQIGGFPINLTTGESITATVDPSNLSLKNIKGLTASMGLMKLNLQGVSFKKEGNAFMVNLDTPMKTFPIKIPII